MGDSTIPITAWQPILTDHQAYTYLEVERLNCGELRVLVRRDESAIRRQQGWADTQVKHIRRRTIPSRGFIRYSLSELRKDKERTHIFGSPFEDPALIFVLLLALILRCKVYLLAEPYSTVSMGYFEDTVPLLNRLKASLRPLVYRLYGLVLRKRISGVFAISELAAYQYSSLGVPDNKIFPYGYFVPNKTIPVTHKPSSHIFRVAFVGSLIKRKGVQLLLDAMRILREKRPEIVLDLYGPGDYSQLRQDATNVVYKGPIKFGRTQHVLSGYDLMVLPSYFDGWGVVVNESLCAGVPVLCSDCVGAKIVVETFNAGAVFPSGRADLLAEVISDLALDRGKLSDMTAACRRASTAIQPTLAAQSMLRTIYQSDDPGFRIRAPWEQILDEARFRD